MKVRSSVRPEDITITANSVLVASNITPYEEVIYDKVQSGFEYDCTEYTKDEYLIKLARENAQLKQDILDTQMALVELYEGGDL